MIQEDIINKNTEVILRTIASDNKGLFIKIKKQYPTLTTAQIFTILLLELDYTITEIVIILGIAAEVINKTVELISNLKSEKY
jgi:hypothetical protein